MVMDLKYHIITIMTVFISLGIGILIGSTMGGNELVIKQQQQLINDLEHKLTNLKTKNNNFKQQVNKLEGKLARNERFQKMILPLVVRDQLTNTQILLVTGSNITKDLKQLAVEIFQLSGVKKIKVVDNRFTAQPNFNKVVFLGEINQNLRHKYEKKEQTVTIKSEQLSNISALIKVVFELASKDLQQMRSVDFET